MSKRETMRKSASRLALLVLFILIAGTLLFVSGVQHNADMKRLVDQAGGDVQLAKDAAAGAAESARSATASSHEAFGHAPGS